MAEPRERLTDLFLIEYRTDWDEAAGDYGEWVVSAVYLLPSGEKTPGGVNAAMAWGAALGFEA